MPQRRAADNKEKERGGFVQIPNSFFVSWRMGILKPVELSVLLVMASFQGGSRGGVARPAMKTVATAIGILPKENSPVDLKRVRLALRQLSVLGFATRLAGGGSGRPRDTAEWRIDPVPTRERIEEGLLRLKTEPLPPLVERGECENETDSPPVNRTNSPPVNSSHVNRTNSPRRTGQIHPPIITVIKTEDKNHPPMPASERAQLLLPNRGSGGKIGGQSNGSGNGRAGCKTVEQVRAHFMALDQELVKAMPGAAIESACKFIGANPNTAKRAINRSDLTVDGFLQGYEGALNDPDVIDPVAILMSRLRLSQPKAAKGRRG